MQHALLSRRAPFATLAAALALSFAAAAPAAQADEPTGTGFRAELLGELAFLEKRIYGLLEAFPQDKLATRPAEDMKTAAALFVHIGNSPFYLGGLLGIARPKDMDGYALEKKLTEKAEITEHLKQGFEQNRKVVGSFPDAQLEETLKTPWGREMSKRNVLALFGKHIAGHLLQLGIYARIAGFTPPWVLEEKKQREAMKAKADAAKTEKSEKAGKKE